MQVNILKISRQLELFHEYQQRVGEMIGGAQAQQLVKNALVLITLGGNDFINNYFLPTISLRRQQYSLPDYCRYLVSEYQKILMVSDHLNDLGHGFRVFCPEATSAT